MHLSAIFGSEAAASVEFNIAKLSDSVLTNCFDLKKTIQLDSLYQSTHHATTMEQLFFNSILTSAFLQHGRVAMKKVTSELYLIASPLSLFLLPFFLCPRPCTTEWGSTLWIYKQKQQKKRNSDQTSHLMLAKIMA